MGWKKRNSREWYNFSLCRWFSFFFIISSLFISIKLPPFIPHSISSQIHTHNTPRVTLVSRFRWIMTISLAYTHSSETEVLYYASMYSHSLYVYFYSVCASKIDVNRFVLKSPSSLYICFALFQNGVHHKNCSLRKSLYGVSDAWFSISSVRSFFFCKEETLSLWQFNILKRKSCFYRCAMIHNLK